MKQEDLEKMCDHLNEREVLSAKAQRDSIKYKQAEYLQDKINSVFKAIITGVTDWGIYAEIIENKCEGLIRINDISSVESYSINPNLYSAIGDQSGNVIRLGDEVMVSVKSINLEKKTIDLRII